MIENSTILPITACLVVAIGAVTDWRTAKIPNKLTFSAAVLGIVMQTVFFGWRGLAIALAGWSTGVALGVVPMLVVQGLRILPKAKKKMGFGDVKLIAALGTFLGPLSVVILFFYFSLLFGLLHIIRLMIDIPWKHISLLVNLYRSGQTAEIAKLLNPKMVKKPIPIGPIIFAGTVLAIVLDKQTQMYFGIH